MVSYCTIWNYVTRFDTNSEKQRGSLSGRQEMPMTEQTWYIGTERSTSPTRVLRGEKTRFTQKTEVVPDLQIG
jgi:hypothetical protein